VVAGSLVDDTVLSIAQGTGEPDDIPGPRSCNFRLYGLVFHWIIDLVFLSGIRIRSQREIRSSIQEGFNRILSRKILARRLPAELVSKIVYDSGTIGGQRV
jgi:hypothetical protein